MTKNEIISLLTVNHRQFVAEFKAMNENQFTVSANGKWNSSQQLDHIIRAVQPVVFAFSLPAILLRLFFGRPNRLSKSFPELVAKYQTKLAAGGRASGRFVPKGFPFTEKEKAIEQLNRLVEKLNTKVQAKGENELDELLLPHPLLGKLTLREMLYFTAYHAEHHRTNTIINLQTVSTRT